jgi:CHAT domain-containing protein/tetratricopeptide (TPR) repeat protein
MLQRLLAMYEKKYGHNHPEVGLIVWELADYHAELDLYAKAEPLYKQAIAIFEKAPKDTWGHNLNTPDRRNVLAPALNSLARFYHKRGRYAEAERLYKQTIAMGVNNDNVSVRELLNELAGLYRDQGRYAEAEPPYKRALAIVDKAFNGEGLDVANALNNLASLYMQQSRYADAEPLFKRALAIHADAWSGHDVSGSGDLDGLVTSLNGLAELYCKHGRYVDALPLVLTAIEHGRERPSVALPVLYGAQDAGLIPAGQVLDGALIVAQRSAQSTAAAAVNQLGARLAAGTGHLADLVRDDQNLKGEGEKLDKARVAAFERHDAAAEQKIRDRLAAIAEKRTALQQVFAAEFPDYAALSNPQPLTVTAIQALLSDGEALLFYATGDKESYVFAVTRTSAAWKSIPLGTAALSDKVAAFRRALDVAALRRAAKEREIGGKPVELFDLGLANELYVSLVGPVEDLVKDARHVLVVPSGPLTSLPFHLLVTEKPATAILPLKDIGSYRDAAWLLKRQAVSVLPALASLKALRRGGARREPGARPLVGFGDSVFDPAERATALAKRRDGQTSAAVTQGYSDFWQGIAMDRAKLAQSLPSLLDTADELKAVATKLGAAPEDLHLAADATEAAVKQTVLADYRVVFFATHGLVAGDIKGLGEPSLVLTLPQTPTDVDDGVLTASEVAQLKLNADWVILSACNTAAADKPGAEALSGLARAFFYAGTRALLVSHWSVDSKAAARLITSMFEIMKADPKLGRAEALRRAMLADMNDKSSPGKAYPAFWGPFSIIGEGAAR